MIDLSIAIYGGLTTGNVAPSFFATKSQTSKIMSNTKKNSEKVTVELTSAENQLIELVASVGGDFIAESLMKVHDITVYFSETALEYNEKQYLYRVKELADTIKEIKL